MLATGNSVVPIEGIKAKIAALLGSSIQVLKHEFVALWHVGVDCEVAILVIVDEIFGVVGIGVGDSLAEWTSIARISCREGTLLRCGRSIYCDCAGCIGRDLEGDRGSIGGTESSGRRQGIDCSKLNILWCRQSSCEADYPGHEEGLQHPGEKRSVERNVGRRLDWSMGMISKTW